jgi:hypothetical protein
MDTGDISRVTAIIAADGDAMAALRAVRALALPQGWIGAGFVRNRVWDHLSGIPMQPQNDVDVVYFDPGDLDGLHEHAYERRLAQALPEVPWQVRNQARMHLRNDHPPYADVADALSRWPETATAIAVRLDARDRPELLAPCGLGDLLSLVCRPTRDGSEQAELVRTRVHSKRWRELWPKVVFLD